MVQLSVRLGTGVGENSTHLDICNACCGLNSSCSIAGRGKSSRVQTFQTALGFHPMSYSLGTGG
jgi:hypothetical protein